jgi:hypothetical protein
MKRYTRNPDETREEEEENVKFKAENLRIKIYLVCYFLSLFVGFAIGLYRIRP